MTEKKQIKLNSILVDDVRFINDPKIKQLIKECSWPSANPNSLKYLECRINLDKKHEVNYEPAKRTIQSFEYEPKFDLKFKANKYFGPYFIEGENRVFVGQMIGDKREGRGVLLYPDGNIYEGYFENDVINLKGKFLFDNGDIYVGEIKNMDMNGQGIYYNNTEKSKYIGSFSEGSPHGQGKEEWEDGTQYEGTFLNGAKEGKGVFKTKDGGIYEGELKAGRFDGHGKLTASSKIKYIGTWKSAELQSPAEIIYEDGKKYTGEISKDLKPHGKGQIQSDKRKLLGNFINGNLDGQIQAIYSNGETKVGFYDNGVFMKWIDDTPNNRRPNEENVELSGVKKPDLKKGPNISGRNSVLGGNNALEGQQQMGMVNPTQPAIGNSAGQEQKAEASKTVEHKKKKFFCC